MNSEAGLMKMRHDSSSLLHLRGSVAGLDPFFGCSFQAAPVFIVLRPELQDNRQQDSCGLVPIFPLAPDKLKSMVRPAEHLLSLAGIEALSAAGRIGSMEAAALVHSQSLPAI